MKKLTRPWVRKAEADLALARREADSAAPNADGICFHCQQCAEKYLKALLQEQGDPIPRTHSLDRLLRLLLPAHAGLLRLQRGLRMLSRYAVETRYPGLNATRRQANSALRWAGRVRAATRPLLGLGDE